MTDNPTVTAIVETAARDVADAILDHLADADTWGAASVLSALHPVSRLDHLVTNRVLQGVRFAKNEVRAADVTAADIDGRK